MIRFFQSIYKYIFYSRTCFFQILYLSVFAFFNGYMISNAAPFAYKLYPDYNHLIIPLTISGINLTAFILACTSNPGIITKSNLKELASLYEYDERIYERNKKCVTCMFAKPARSKHCSITNKCIYRFDHYCIWICNPVGGNNIKYFIFLLYTLAIILISGIYNVWKVLNCIVAVEKLWGKKVVVDGAELGMDFYNLVKILFCRYPIICMIGTSSIILVVWVLFFVIDHTLLIIANITTNERHKLYQFNSNQNMYKTNKKFTNLDSDNLEQINNVSNNQLCDYNIQQNGTLVFDKVQSIEKINIDNKLNSLDITNKDQILRRKNLVLNNSKSLYSVTDQIHISKKDNFFSIYDRGILQNIKEVFCPIKYKL